MTSIIILLLSLFTADSVKSISTDQLANYVQQEETYFLLDSSTLSFEQIPRTKASVDSLLKTGNEQRDRDSRESFNAARQALTIAIEIGYKKGLAESYSLMGSKYIDFGDHEFALYHYLRALSIQETLGNQRAIANSFNNIARVHVEQENYQEAANYLEASIETLKILNEDQEALNTTNNLGVIHRRQGNYEVALDYFWETAQQALSVEPDSLLYIIATLNIGNTYRNLGNLQRAKIHLHSARDYVERHEYISHLIYTDIVLGQLYKDLGDYHTGLEYAVSAVELASKGQYRERMKDGHLLIAEIQEQLGNYNQAFEHFKLHHLISDTLLSMQRGERINELQARFDVEQKDREIDLLNKEAALKEAKIAQQDQFKSFLISGLLLLFVIIVLLFRANRQKQVNNLKLKESRKEIERQNSKLNALNREKDEFISIAAHDLRNPLSSINMAVDLINSEENINKKTLHEYCELIKISSARMLNLINNVLHIQTITDNPSQDKSVKNLDVNQLVEDSVKNFQKPATSKEINLHLVLSKEKMIFLGDDEKVLRIFDNLISNAIKYSPQQTIVTISTKLVSNKVQIAIEDQGPGIRKKDLPKLFGKFVRLSNKPTGNETSTGLGLFIVKKITNSMGGRVWCESEPGKGSVFIVELPVTEKSSTSIYRGKRQPKAVIDA